GVGGGPVGGGGGGVGGRGGVAEGGGRLPAPGPPCAAAPIRAVSVPAGPRLASDGEVGDETAQVAGAGAAPAVDRLAGIPHGGDRMAGTEQGLQQHQLRVAGVLVLVEQHDLVAGP